MAIPPIFGYEFNEAGARVPERSLSEMSPLEYALSPQTGPGDVRPEVVFIDDFERLVPDKFRGPDEQRALYMDNRSFSIVLEPSG
jgi:hypothetical protein